LLGQEYIIGTHMMNGSQKSICIIGILLAIIPFLGFPGSVESFFVFALGVSVSIIAFASSRKKKSFGERVMGEIKSIASQVFVENSPTTH